MNIVIDIATKPQNQPVSALVIAFTLCLVFNFIVGLIVCYQQAKTRWDKQRLGELERFIKDQRKQRATDSTSV